MTSVSRAAISAGLVSAILVGGALLAPVADWKGLSSSRGAGDGDAQTVRLAEAPNPADARPGDSRPGPSGPTLTVPGPDGTGRAPAGRAHGRHARAGLDRRRRRRR